jgi:hypothetical protein
MYLKKDNRPIWPVKLNLRTGERIGRFLVARFQGPDSRFTPGLRSSQSSLLRTKNWALARRLEPRTD